MAAKLHTTELHRVGYLVVLYVCGPGLPAPQSSDSLTRCRAFRSDTLGDKKKKKIYYSDAATAVDINKRETDEFQAKPNQNSCTQVNG